MTMPYHIIIGSSLTPKGKKDIEAIIPHTSKVINKTVNNWNPDSEVSRFSSLPANRSFTTSPIFSVYYCFLIKPTQSPQVNLNLQ